VKIELNIDPYEQTWVLFDAHTSKKYKDSSDVVTRLHENSKFLKEQFLLLQERLEEEGILFVNDVLYALGLKRTNSGHFLGWTKDVLYTIEHSVRYDGFNIILIPETLIYDKFE